MNMIKPEIDSPRVALHLHPNKVAKHLPEVIDRYSALWDALESTGTSAVITAGKEAYDLNQASPTALEWYDPRSAERQKGSLAVGSALDTSGGFARYVNNERVLNPVGLRNLCRDKLATYALLQTVQPRSLMVASTSDRADVPEFLADLTGKNVVLKKAHSANSSGVSILPRDAKAVADTLDPDPTKAYLLQEFIPHSTTMPGLRDAAPNEGALATSKQDFQLRALVVDTTPVLWIGRTFPDNDYISLDQDSIPEAMHDLVMQTATSLRDESAATNSYVALDVTMDRRDGRSYVGDVNGKFPTFVPYWDGRTNDSQRLGRGLSQKLRRMADE